MTDPKTRTSSGSWPESHQIREQLQATLSGTYTLERELGGGGMSRVFVAEELRLRRKVAVKILSPELAQGLSIERFEREIQMAAALQQANIVPVLSAGDSNGLPYYTMPFVDGESLRARLARGPLELSEAIGVLRDVSKALTYAHARGVVHRDIKPDNVLISGGTAVVTDFGIAKALRAARAVNNSDAALTQIGMSIGTPAYMAPEQAAGDPDVDHRADIYALGAMAYELLCGHSMFAGRTPQRMMVAHMSEAPTPINELRADVSPALSALIMSCLAKEAQERPQNTSDITRILDSISSGAGMQGTPSSHIGGAQMFRRALIVYVIACVVVPLVAKAAIVAIGLPDWVFSGSLLVMALGLPVVLWTGYVERVSHRALIATPTQTPGGTDSVERGAIAMMALKAAPKVSWSRTARGGAMALSVFVIAIVAIMSMRVMGVGPFASLVASGALHNRDKILIADFTASNGDKALGRVVSDAIRAGLGDSRVMTVMSPAEVGGALQRMQQPTDARIDISLARQIALREGAKAIVEGEVAVVGTSYIVSARLVSADSARQLATFQATASSSDAIIEVADGLSRKLRAKAGESLRGVQATPALAYATTSSLEALRKYSDAVRTSDVNRDYLGSAAQLREAVALDSNFAEAWRKLAVVMRNARTYPQSSIDSALRRGFSLKDRLMERERDMMLASYYMGTPGLDRAKAEAALKRMLARGDSQYALNNLATLAITRKELARAESLFLAASRLSLSPALTAGNLQLLLRRSGKTQAYDSLVADTKIRFPGNAAVIGGIFEGMMDHGEFAEAAKALDSARKNSDQRRLSEIYTDLGDLALLRGRPSEHRDYYHKSFAFDSASGEPASVLILAIVRLADALDQRAPTESYVADVDRILAATNLDALPAADRPYLQLARVYASAGQADRAKQFVAKYEALPMDTAAKRYLVNDLRYAQSAIQLAEGKWQESAKSLQQAFTRPDGYGAPSYLNNTFVMAFDMDRIDLFATANQADSALAAYNTYLKTPLGARKREGPDMWIGGGRYEALAKMYDAKGDTTNAVAHYRDMIEMWKDAEPGLQPRVTQARARVRELTPVEKVRKQQ